MIGLWYGEGGGRRVQDGEHMYNFFLIKIEKKKKKEEAINQRKLGPVLRFNLTELFLYKTAGI